MNGIVREYADDAKTRMPRRAVFLDKDGTLVHNVPYNVDPRKIKFTAGALSGLQRLADEGYALVVITHQPGVALGHFSRADLDRVANAIAQRMADAGLALAGFYACPHGASQRERTACTCRQPAPGLLQRAARELELMLERSWVIGDMLDDVEAGARANCRTVLLDVGNETEWRWSPLRRPTLRARDLDEAAQALLAADRSARVERALA